MTTYALFESVAASVPQVLTMYHNGQMNRAVESAAVLLARLDTIGPCAMNEDVYWHVAADLQAIVNRSVAPPVQLTMPLDGQLTLF